MQHFLLASRARTLSLVSIFRLTDAEVEATFRRIRWADTGGEPVCPACSSAGAYDCRRPNGAPRFRCRVCQRDFSLTSGTIFASLKRPLRIYLAAVTIFCNAQRGKSMLSMSRDLGMSYKAAFVLCHKIREAMAQGMRDMLVGGEGKVVEVDGAYFGGYVKPANLKEKRIDRRLAMHLTRKRKTVVVMRERGGRCVPGVFKNEGRAVQNLISRILRETIAHADEASSWEELKYRNGLRGFALDFRDIHTS